MEIFWEQVRIKNELRFKESVTNEVRFNKSDNFRSDYLIADKKNIFYH